MSRLRLLSLLKIRQKGLLTGRPLVSQLKKKPTQPHGPAKAQVGRRNYGKDLGVEKVVPIGCSVLHFDGFERPARLVVATGR